MASITTGVFYFIIRLFGTTVVSLLLILPKAFVITIAGLVLLSILGNSLNSALSTPWVGEAALITLLVTVSGLYYLNIGAAFWAVVIDTAYLYALSI